MEGQGRAFAVSVDERALAVFTVFQGKDPQRLQPKLEHPLQHDSPAQLLSADHPEIFASEDQGITPVEFVLVGLASCLTAGIAAVAQNRGIQLRSVQATIEGGMDIQGILGIDSDVRNGFDGITVRYQIDADATPEEIRALVAQSQKRSAVYDVVTNPTNVTVEVNQARA